MENKKPDNVVHSKDNGYNASFLPYATSVGAPVIKVDDIVAWKARGVHNVNKEFEGKFNELKLQYQQLVEDFQWNDLVYNCKFSFEPVIGEIYHMYNGTDNNHFLSLIAPNEWNREHIATFKLNSERKWIMLERSETFSF
jgi:Protein of unknown function (DUF2452)